MNEFQIEVTTSQYSKNCIWGIISEQKLTSIYSSLEKLIRTIIYMYKVQHVFSNLKILLQCKEHILLTFLSV